MTRLIEILISLAIVAVLFVTVGFLLPSSRHIENSVETNRKLTIVYDTISSFSRFDEWNTLALRDPGMDLKISGPEQGVGATLSYDSDVKEVGEGSWEIIEAVPNKSVTFRITDDKVGKNKVTKFILEPTGRNDRNVKITQTYDVDYGMNLIGRYAGMYVGSNFGGDMKVGLSRLSNMLAAVPNFDYAELSKDDATMAPQIGQRPAQTLLVVGAAVERNNDVVQRTMKNNMQWINKVMEANNLEPAGPVRIITNEFGSENYAFEVAQPVRLAGSGEGDEAAGDEADAATGDEAEGEEAAADAVVNGASILASAKEFPSNGPLEIKLQGPVELVEVAAGPVAMVPFKGHMANLSNVRDALRGWAMTRGHQTVERPYEAWVDGIDAGFTENGEFVVYWALK
ncbi:hypothetical protein N799_12780 [Lysobacter arseniciresistens ZS79]|uniref:Polyketide cyclase n=1 Tax=Lysobacter arseniciresistens ZS79 TaxID=913325 RepID=A0A0A0F3X5_9GAMM|nr:SRPBCC family protein [Lysobacter arseniciresistens]KGM57058.1 hypothetical protein N799_12780 [Lysobacter arseniciresistens ZS79]